MKSIYIIYLFESNYDIIIGIVADAANTAAESYKDIILLYCRSHHSRDIRKLLFDERERTLRGSLDSIYLATYHHAIYSLYYGIAKNVIKSVGLELPSVKVLSFFLSLLFSYYQFNLSSSSSSSSSFFLFLCICTLSPPAVCCWPLFLYYTLLYNISDWIDIIIIIIQ